MRSFENTCMLLLCFHTYLVIMPQSYLQGTKFRSVSTQVRICLDSSTHDMTLSKVLWHLAVATNFFSVRGTEDDSSKLQVPRWEFLCLCNFFHACVHLFCAKWEAKLLENRPVFIWQVPPILWNFELEQSQVLWRYPKSFSFGDFGCNELLEFCKAAKESILLRHLQLCFYCAGAMCGDAIA